MSYILIAVMQEVSETVCGTALPTEMCNYILDDCGGKLQEGMQTPSARVMELSRSSLRLPRRRLKRALRRTMNPLPLRPLWLPDWAKDGIQEAKRTNLIWPYASDWAVVCAIDRDQEVLWSQFAASRKFWAAWNGPDPPKPWDPLRKPQPLEEIDRPKGQLSPSDSNTNEP